MSTGAENDGWPTNPANPANNLASIARLAGGEEILSRDARGRFLTGNSGGGRPKGARNKLTDSFAEIIAADFAMNGAAAVAKLRESDPLAYIRIVTMFVARNRILKTEEETDYSSLTDAEFTDLMMKSERNKMRSNSVKSARGE